MSDATLTQRLKDELQPQLQTLEKESDAQKAAMQGLIGKLSDAIRASDQASIRRLSKSLEDQVGGYSQLIVRTKRLLALVEALRSNDADAIKRATALRDKIDTLHAKMARNYAAMKALLDQAHRKLDDPAIAAVMAQWTELEAWITAQHEVAGIRVQQMLTLLELARSAVAAGDAAGLAQAQARAKVRLTWKPLYLEASDRVMRFCDACAKVLGKDLQDQLKRDIAKFRRMVPEMAGLNDQLDKHYESLKAVKMPAQKSAALDIRKAAGLLHLDEAKLRKAWGSGPSAPEKVLDGLAREAKVKGTGKQMLATLKKAKLLA